MPDTLRDPDDRSHEKDNLSNTYHDEEPEIQNDEVSGRRSGHALPRRKTERRPPPRKRHYED